MATNGSTAVWGGAFVTEAGDEATRWLERARDGDRRAYERLYRHHVGAIHAFCLRLTGRRSEAEEMTQELFVRAWQHLASIRNGDHLAAWLRHVAMNMRRNDLRRIARHGEAAELDLDTGDIGSLERVEAGGLRVDLDEALTELPDGAREVLVLHDVYGYKHREIAERLGLAVGTTKAQLHRARKRLRERLTR